MPPVDLAKCALQTFTVMQQRLLSNQKPLHFFSEAQVSFRLFSVFGAFRSPSTSHREFVCRVARSQRFDVLMILAFSGLFYGTS